jgi:hypothetical protein
VLLGWLTIALGNALWLCVTKAEPDGFGARAVFHLYDFAQSTMLGVALFGAMLGFRRWLAPGLGKRAAPLGWALASVISALLGVLLLRDDLAGAASRLVSGHDSALVRALVCGAVALAVPASFAAGSPFRRGWLRAVPVCVALLGFVLNQRLLVGDYAGVHLLAGSCVAALLASTVVGLPLSLPRRSSQVAVATLVVLTLGALLWTPPANVVAPLGQTWTAALAPVLPRTWLTHQAPTSVGGVYVPGLGGKPVPPSGLRIAPRGPVVILMTVDSLRADLLTDAHRAELPNMHLLRDQSTWFTQARSPGTQTAITLTSVMMDTYYSQQYWTPCYVPEGRGVRVLFAHEDDGVRFPELLSAAGVSTVQYGQAIWLEGKYGMTRGFSEHHTVAPVPGRPSTKGKWSTGDDVWPLLQKRLEAQGPGPMFLFFHDLDPHAPFDLGRVKHPARAAYLSELQRVDDLLGRLLATLKRTGLDQRTVLIFSADHGEAFGEHGNSFHGQNLYEELVRVPLLIRLPGKPPSVQREPVTLMDLGPTILDLFDLPTPGHFMGQSLVPLLAGKRPELTRPIIAEGRLKQSMVLPNGLKLIHNQKEGTFEIYDLTKDPGEKHNLYDAMGQEGPKQMQKLVAFFDRYRIRRKGYEVPYRR